MPPAAGTLVRTLPSEFFEKLRTVLEESGWEFSDLPYARFKAVHEKTNVVLYDSGKLVAQGAGANDFIEFVLEPIVLGNAAFQNANPLQAPHEMRPHAGMDESGKGDFFGPLAACAAFTDPETEPKLISAGVRDCKLIKNDSQLLKIADDALRIMRGRAAVVAIGPEAYNRMYSSFGSLNRLLAWAHAKALENLLERVPECTAALADKFGDDSLIRNALGPKGRAIELVQHTKAESDIAVAAASVLARAAFLRKLAVLSKEAGITLPKGAGPGVDEAASRLAVSGGAELLGKFAKMHFRNAYKALGLPPPPKTEWHHPGA